ncbi:MAG: hypothetical protein ACYSU0_07800 [Planctomycetota bacterium]|jgi:hypothetical protein
MPSQAMHMALAFIRRTVRAPLLSPRGLAARAALIALVYTLLHLAGVREYASILSGTLPTGDPNDYLAMTLGVVYVLVHLAFFLVAPVLVLAAGILRGLEHLIARVRRGDAVPLA